MAEPPPPGVLAKIRKSSEMIKRTIKTVSPSDSNANVDTSVSVGSAVQKAPRRCPQPRRSPRLALKTLKGVLVKRRNLSGIRWIETDVRQFAKMAGGYIMFIDNYNPSNIFARALLV